MINVLVFHAQEGEKHRKKQRQSCAEEGIGKHQMLPSADVGDGIITKQIPPTSHYMALHLSP